MSFIKKKIENYKQWFNSPITMADRIKSAFLGAWAGIWIGGLGRIIYETPVGLATVGKFSLFGIIICAVVAALIPKYSRLVFLPFAFFGISN